MVTYCSFGWGSQAAGVPESQQQSKVAAQPCCVCAHSRKLHLLNFLQDKRVNMSPLPLLALTLPVAASAWEFTGIWINCSSTEQPLPSALFSFLSISAGYIRCLWCEKGENEGLVGIQEQTAPSGRLTLSVACSLHMLSRWKCYKTWDSENWPAGLPVGCSWSLIQNMGSSNVGIGNIFSPYCEISTEILLQEFSDHWS